MANLSLLRTYATKAPSEFPDSVLFTHTDRTLTIYDAYPKAIFHFLALPRIHDQTDSGLSLKDLHSLKTLLACDKTRAKELITALKDDSEEVKKDIESEMVRRYGFKWPIWTGFHASPSMHHLHLHIISADLCSEKLKHKKHYNSFHPKLGFFLHVDDVLPWFDSESSHFSQMAKLDAKRYEALLKEDLTCFHCDKSMKNIPTLKEHLQQEWNSQAARHKAKDERKRKLEAKKDEESSEDGSNKKQKSS
ncbi:aprataxin-like protein [Marasmius sp. AFHP31]|nr:aprataxin-like protein [Marasmius sp. AFHP31]